MVVLDEGGEEEEGDARGRKREGGRGVPLIWSWRRVFLFGLAG